MKIMNCGFTSQQIIKIHLKEFDSKPMEDLKLFLDTLAEKMFFINGESINGAQQLLS